MAILGQPTVQDLKDLLTAKDYTISQVGNAYNAFAAQWAAKDVAAQAQWFGDWSSLLARYGKAKSSAQSAIDAETNVASALFPDSTKVVPQSAWDGVLKALKQTYPNSTVTPGDLDDLNNRLTAAGMTPDFSEMPQPAPDADLQIIKAADTTLGLVGISGGGGSSPFPWLETVGGAVVGGLLIGSIPGVALGAVAGAGLTYLVKGLGKSL